MKANDSRPMDQAHVTSETTTAKKIHHECASQNTNDTLKPSIETKAKERLAGQDSIRILTSDESSNAALDKIPDYSSDSDREIFAGVDLEKLQEIKDECSQGKHPLKGRLLDSHQLKMLRSIRGEEGRFKN